MIWRVGCTTNDTDVAIAIWRLEHLIEECLTAVEASAYQIYLSPSDGSNFRYQLAADYKANRTQEKPVHYQALREHLIQKMGATVVEGMEADDALGEAQIPETCIVTIDKDLDQIPGFHYNFVRDQLYNIGLLEAHRSFYWQVLVGDRTDNVQGCPGIGKAKADRLLDGCLTENEMLLCVIKQYRKAFHRPSDNWEQKLLLAGRLLWIRRKNQPEWCINSEAASKSGLRNYLTNWESGLSMSATSLNTSSLNPDTPTLQTSK